MKVCDLILDSVVINGAPAVANCGYVMSPDGKITEVWDIRRFELTLEHEESQKIVNFVTDLLRERINKQAKADGVEV